MGYIYKITSPSKKVYIGQTIDIVRRRKEYSLLKCKSQRKLYLSLLKYGWLNHVFDVICECDDSKMNEVERYYQDLYSAIGNKSGLNLKLTTSSDQSGRYSIELKKKMSGKNHHMYGKTHTPEARLKISKTHKGKTISLEHRKQISDKMKEIRTGCDNPFYGKTHTDHNKIKISLRTSGGLNPRALTVLNTETGIFYDTMADASKSLGISYDLMKYRIRKNIITNFKIV